MSRLSTRLIVLLFALVALPLAAFAQPAIDGDSATVTDQEILEEIPPQIIIDIPPQGIGYSDEGELLLVATMTNIGTQASQPMDLIAIVLNDCIIGELPQTCRFAAFGAFEDVTPNGIPAGTTVQWTFNFGIQPQVDLSRWSVIWYQIQ